MYVDYLEYQRFARGNNVLTEEEYKRDAPLADALIDHWTLERVGKAVHNEEELPDIVKAVYVSIVDNMDVLSGSGELVSHFSNGVDSYTFDTENTEATRLKNYAMSILPVEWISADVYFKGGNDYAG